MREPGEPFRHMAASAPSKAPVVLCVAAIMAPPGAIQSTLDYPDMLGPWKSCPVYTLVRSGMAREGAMNGSLTWARLIMEQELPIWSQNGSFSSICANYLVLLQGFCRFITLFLKRNFFEVAFLLEKSVYQ